MNEQERARILRSSLKTMAAIEKFSHSPHFKDHLKAAFDKVMDGAIEQKDISLTPFESMALIYLSFRMFDITPALVQKVMTDFEPS